MTLPTLSKIDEPEEEKPKKKKSWYRFNVFRVIFLVGFFSSIVAGVFTWLWLEELGVLEIKDDQLEIITSWRPSDNTIIYDRKGEKIGEFFTQYNIFVPFKDLPRHFIKAVTAIEDRKFWEHKGIDPKAMFRAALIHLKQLDPKYRQGASTITQQVVRHFLLPKEKTIDRKVREIALALKLEKLMSKQRIFEIYVNSMFLGSGSYGVGAAAYRYFGKSISEIEPHESALIAGLFQSPSRYNPHRYPKRARNRQKQVFRALHAAKYAGSSTIKKWFTMPLNYKPYTPLYGESSPYFIDFVAERAQKILRKPVKNQGLRIYTTLDSRLQKITEDAVKNSDEVFKKAQQYVVPVRMKDGKWGKPPIEAAALVQNPRTGEILAMVGGRDYKQSQFNRTVDAYRSPGSAFKPILYSLALMSGYRWSDLIYVAPLTVNGTYRPRNPTKDYMTETTLLRAFYRSMNGPTVEIAKNIDLKVLAAHARKIGIATKVKTEMGSVLGGSEVRMLDLARAYSTFAHSGKRTSQIAITRIESRKGRVLYRAPDLSRRQKRAISPQIAYLMTRGMRAVLSHGTGYKSGRLANFAVGKTGTSNEAKDNWFCGYSPDLTAIVWVGTDHNVPMRGKASAANLALPIWDKIMTEASKFRKARYFPKPRGLVSYNIHSRYGYRDKDGMRMWFLYKNRPPEDTNALKALDLSGNYRNVFAK